VVSQHSCSSQSSFGIPIWFFASPYACCVSMCLVLPNLLFASHHVYRFPKCFPDLLPKLDSYIRFLFLRNDLLGIDATMILQYSIVGWRFRTVRSSRSCWIWDGHTNLCLSLFVCLLVSILSFPLLFFLRLHTLCSDLAFCFSESLPRRFQGLMRCWCFANRSYGKGRDGGPYSGCLALKAQFLRASPMCIVDDTNPGHRTRM
jgi:hypothetical protein